MKGDFSRNAYDSAKHYIGVRWQQGRPTTDNDENEAQEIFTGRIETADLDTIGSSGAPKVNPGFGLSTDSDGRLMIGAGHYYVDGILVENEEAARYDQQPHFPNEPSIANAMGNAEAGLVVLEVFKRHITHHDDPALRDVALNGVDTTTRVQTVWRVHLLPLGINIPNATMDRLVELIGDVREIDSRISRSSRDDTLKDLHRLRERAAKRLEEIADRAGLACGRAYDEWDNFTAAANGTLTVTTIPGDTDEDPCNVPETGGYTRGENQYYRVEVHNVANDGRRNGSTFKFSRDNGAIVASIEAVGSATSGSASGTVFDVDSVKRDDYIGIFENDWVEYVDDRNELSGAPGVLAQVTGADSNLNRITLDRSITVNLNLNPKLRKWDQVAPLAGANGVAMNTNATPVSIEGGIQLFFSPGTYRAGDYWQFAARANDASLDFPPDEQLPFGIERHFVRLGMIIMGVSGRIEGRRPLVLLDCRDLFPPLTDITAADVSFDNSECELPDVETVQDAIEALCARIGGGGTCTFTVSPGNNWFNVFDQIPQGGDAEICFEVGDYELDKPVTVERKGILKLSGAGAGTRILARTSESALNFRICQSVIVEDLFAEAGETTSGEGIQGALSFENCVTVTLNRLTLRCEAGNIRSAACLRVSNDREFGNLRTARGTVDVQNCFFQVGSSQLGALVTNGSRVLFENNIIRCQDLRKKSQLVVSGLIENVELRAEVRRTLFSDVQEGSVSGQGRVSGRGASAARANAGERRNLLINDIAVNFRSDPELERIKFYDQLLDQFSPRSVGNFSEAVDYLQESVDAVLMKPESISRFDTYLGRLIEQDVAALYQGITIGGEEAEEVRIVNNTIIDALQGVHIGQSRANQPREERLRSTVVSIEGNTIYSRIAPAINREAYGIYIGNCDSLYIENNALQREPLTATRHLVFDGVHVVGELGTRAIVRHNETENYRFGVYIDPQSSLKQPLWLVAENVANVLATDSRVQVVNNVS